MYLCPENCKNMLRMQSTWSGDTLCHTIYIPNCWSLHRALICAPLPGFNMPCSMSQCFCLFFFCIFCSKFVALLCKINLCAQKNHQISTEVTGQYLNTVAILNSICSGSCKLCPYNYFFTAVTALYYGFLCGMSHSLYEHCKYSTGMDCIPSCTFSVISMTSLRAKMNVSLTSLLTAV